MRPVSSQYRVAQINIARMIAPLGDPVMHGFVSRLAELNELADRSPGFVWRLQGDAGDATSIRAFDDPALLVNMSVWETVEALHAYVYRSQHGSMVRDRKNWFQKLDGPYYAIWWVPRGHIPSVEEGKDRLASLAQHGATPHAFWFGDRFPSPDAPPASDPQSDRIARLEGPASRGTGRSS
jgi:hypothetical protein